MRSTAFRGVESQAKVSEILTQVKDLGKQAFNLGMGMAFKLKAVRMQAFERMPEMYIQLHKQILKSGKE